ncbi:MAG TPA: ABC transporter permease [Geminicoccaceae bacterium]|nr:ABC transporter permease [Geminicoccaceae bacterium]
MDDLAPARYEMLADPAAADTIRLQLSGSWRLSGPLPPIAEVARQLEGRSGIRRILVEARDLAGWDSGLLMFLRRLDGLARGAGLETDASGLPEGVRRLLSLAAAVPERAGARRGAARESFLARVGRETIALVQASGEVVAFLGEVTIAFGRLFRGQARFRRSDLMVTLQEVGAQALPIVSLISFLVGVILAFLGSIQLLQFGAQIYVADLVGIGMARDMAAMMVGIILAGRTGAAFAAQLGSMQVNEEIDALATLGLSPMDFLVLPRVLALIVMTPLLCLYANLMGLLGGAFVGVAFLDLPAVTYLQETQYALQPADFTGGLIKGAVYGIVVAIAGCLRGMQCGRSSAAVGQATTSAVVTSIVFIVISMAILTLIYDALGV